MIREELPALADELESCGPDCDECPAFEQAECRGYRECTENVSRYCARRIREVVERDEREVTTVSAYDLLSDDDRKAIALVRDHGGIDAVNKRLMPEGMEWLLEVWPKWSNGEYCKFGDWWTAAKYGYYEPKQLRRLGFYTPEQLKEWEQDEGDNYGYEWNFMRPSNTNYRPDKAETPAFKVLAADGEPLEVGQTVYATHYDYVRCTVLSFEWAVDGWLVEVENEGGNKFRQTPDCFTHQRPVLDEDGVPIKVGDTVWDIETGIEFEVTGIASAFEIRVKDESMKIGVWTTPCGFTHAKPEPPDSWERIEEDATRMPGEYCERYGIYGDSFPQAEAMSCDLVRRCRALAEKENRNE